MATQPSTYYWDLGIDWDLVPTIVNASFMPGSFVLRGATDALDTIQRPCVLPGQTIIFRIFDLKANAVEKIESFAINPQIAVLAPGSPLNANINPLDSLQPKLPPDSSPAPASARADSIYFGKGLPCWTYDRVAIRESASGKFLLNFLVQATGTDSFILRTFVHDPEMIVGAHPLPAHGAVEEGASRTRSL